MTNKRSILEVLRRAYLEQPGGPPRQGWEEDLMTRIRAMGPLEPLGGLLGAFESLFWRLAPVTCLLIFLLSLVLAGLEPSPADDYLAMVGAEVEGPGLTDAFGEGGS